MQGSDFKSVQDNGCPIIVIYLWNQKKRPRIETVEI